MSTVQERHPDMFLPVRRASPRGYTRKVPLEVLNLGMCRTGTATMAVALGILGIRCYHSHLWFSTNIGDCEMWDEALNAKYFGKGIKYTRREWDQLLHDFGAVSDAPACVFAEDLIEAYPEARVILVSRDTEDWYGSFVKIVLQPVLSLQSTLLAIIDPWTIGPMVKTHRLWLKGWLSCTSADEARERARDRYVEHKEAIQLLTPRENLLNFDLRDGWQPLCSFLSKPIPNVPFPHANDKNWLREKNMLLAKRSLQEALIARSSYLTLIAIVIGAVWWCHR